MKVALVHDWLSNIGGSEQVLLSLHKIFPRAPIFTSVYNKQALPQFKNATIITGSVNKFPFAKKRPQLYISYLPRIFEGFDFSDFDLVISSCHAVSKGIITKPETMHICYCHTPIRYIWMPYLDPRLSKNFVEKTIAHNLRIWDFEAAQRPNKYIANSKNVALRIKKFYKRESDVIYPPVFTSFYEPLKSQNDLGNFYLLVGRLVAYKKPEIVIEAFNKLGLPLKIIGSGPELSRLSKMANKNIQFLGKLDQNELKIYYQKALAFIFPAEEDFGIVPVEAMASGRPVIAYKKGGVLETILEGKTGEFFEEQSTESLINKIKDFNPSKYDPKIIRKRALEFDEDIFKNKISEYIKNELTKFNSEGL